MNEVTALDVLYITDLRFPGGSSSSLVEEARAASAEGYRLGVMQCRSSSLRADRTFHPGIRALIDDGSLLLIRPGEPIECGLVIVKHPTVMVESIGGRLPVKSQAVVAFVGQVPHDDDGTTYYEPSLVHENIAEALGESPVWHPVSPTVRSRLKGSGVPLAPKDWVEVIDPASWTVPRSGLIGELPVIGRHGRPSARKWPNDFDDLTAVYPIDGRAVVRVLGGTAGLENLLDNVPPSWEVREFGSIDPRKFLGEVDFFVYFHHRDLVEAFGRTVIEALSAGCVAILPPHFEELFGEACLYAEPAEVGPLITSLHADTEAFLEQSCRGLEEVSKRFSHRAHVDRLRGLIGEPAAAGCRTAPSLGVPRGFVDQRPTVLVSCLGAGPSRTAEVIRTVVAQRDYATGFDPVVLCDSPTPLVAGHLGEELELDAKSRRFVGSETGIVVELIESRDSFTGEGSWEDYVLGRLTDIRRRRRISTITVADLNHPDAWLVLGALA